MINFEFKEVDGKLVLIESKTTDVNLDTLLRRLDMVKQDQSFVMRNVAELKKSFERNKEIINLLEEQIANLSKKDDEDIFDFE